MMNHGQSKQFSGLTGPHVRSKDSSSDSDENLPTFRQQLTEVSSDENITVGTQKPACWPSLMNGILQSRRHQQAQESMPVEHDDGTPLHPESSYEEGMITSLIQEDSMDEDRQEASQEETRRNSGAKVESRRRKTRQPPYKACPDNFLRNKLRARRPSSINDDTESLSPPSSQSDESE